MHAKIPFQASLRNGSGQAFKSDTLLLHLAIITLLVLLTFTNSLFNHFNIDDPSVLLDVEAVHGLTLKNIKTVFTSVHNSVEYLPVRDISYCLDYELWGLRPFGYHLSNLIYYLFACVMLYMFLREFLMQTHADGGDSIALLSAAFFSVHPVHVESVAGIAQRKDLVSGMFFFLSLWSLLRSLDGERRWAFYSIALISFILSMLSKATAVVMPLVAMILFAVYLKEARKKVWQLSPFFVAAGIITALFIFIGTDAGIIKNDIFLKDRLPVSVGAVFYYLKLLVIPYPLKIWHEFSINGFESIPYLAGLLLLIYFALLLKPRYGILSFSIVWYLVCLLPVVGLLPTASVLAERYLFLPSVGITTAFAWFLHYLIKGKHKPRILTVTYILIAVLSIISIQRNMDWKNTESLLMAGLRHDRNSVKYNRDLGRYHFINRRYEKAFQFLEVVKQLDPSQLDYEFHLVWYQVIKKNYLQALSLADRYNILGMNAVDTYYLYGHIQEALGNYKEARANYKKALDSKILLGTFFKKDAQASLIALSR